MVLRIFPVRCNVSVFELPNITCRLICKFSGTSYGLTEIVDAVDDEGTHHETKYLGQVILWKIFHYLDVQAKNMSLHL